MIGKGLSLPLVPSGRLFYGNGDECEYGLPLAYQSRPFRIPTLLSVDTVTMRTILIENRTILRWPKMRVGRLLSAEWKWTHVKRECQAIDGTADNAGANVS